MDQRWYLIVGGIGLLVLVVVAGVYHSWPSRGDERVEGLSSFVEKFTGDKFNTRTYGTKSTGGGIMKQNNLLVTTGKGTDKKIWNVLYTKDDVSFTADFTSQALVTLTNKPPLDGDVMAILGAEKRSVVTTGENSGINCELSRGSHAAGAILRMEDTAGKGSNSIDVLKTKGTMKLSYSAKNKSVSCSFGEAKLSLPQLPPKGRYALTLRSGLHKIVVAYEEGEHAPAAESVQGGTGNFMATFDDWQVTMKK